MGVMGQYVKTFAEANLASAIDVSLNADYPHFFFDVLGVEGKKAKVKSHGNGKEFELPIKLDRKTGREYFVLEQVSTYEAMFKGGKPTKIRFIPMKGERC